MADTQDSDDKLVSSKPDQSNNTNGSTKEDSTENGQISSTSQNGKPLEVEKQQEQKLLARHPGLGNKPGGSKFLQKRLSKGRMFFDSGDYNMTKTNLENRTSSKIVSKTPTRIVSDSSEDEHHLHGNKSGDETVSTATSDSHEEEDEDDDVIDPSKQAIPTPDLLFLRRAARHMPMASSGPAIRRATVQTRRSGLMDDCGVGGILGDSELIADGPVIHPNIMAKRRATLQVPSKLAD